MEPRFFALSECHDLAVATCREAQLPLGEIEERNLRMAH